MKTGDKAFKKNGYKFEGIIVSVYLDLYGEEHADVQVPGEKGVDAFAGMIHVFPTRLLEVRE